MKNRCSLFSFLFSRIIAICALLAAGCSAQPAFQANGSKLYVYSTGQLEKQARRLEPEGRIIDFKLRSASSGDSAVLWVRKSGGSVSVWQFLATGEVRALERLGEPTYYNEAGQPVVWWDNDQSVWRFGIGESRRPYADTVQYEGTSYSIKSYFSVDPSGEYFSIRSTPDKYEVCGVSRPFDPLVIVDDLQVFQVFSISDDIFVFGRNSQRPKVIEFRIYSQLDGVFALRRTGTIELATNYQDALALVDLTPDGRFALCYAGVSGMFGGLGSRWYVYDLEAEQLVKTIRREGFGIFLSDDILAAR